MVELPNHIFVSNKTGARLFSKEKSVPLNTRYVKSDTAYQRVVETRKHARSAAADLCKDYFESRGLSTTPP